MDSFALDRILTGQDTPPHEMAEPLNRVMASGEDRHDTIRHLTPECLIYGSFTAPYSGTIHDHLKQCDTCTKLFSEELQRHVNQHYASRS